MPQGARRAHTPGLPCPGLADIVGQGRSRPGRHALDSQGAVLEYHEAAQGDECKRAVSRSRPRAAFTSMLWHEGRCVILAPTEHPYTLHHIL